MNPAQPLHLFLRLFCAVALVLQTESTAAAKRRRRRKISVPVGYKFSPTDGDLVNHHLKQKLINLPQQYCLIPDHNLYEAEPWDLITKYNELSDGESNNDECFFFSTNRSSKRVNRRTPNGRWHETSEKKTIQGSDGVAYVMRYFTFKIGHQRRNTDITAWRMREFTDPSKPELALCKIFKDVDGQKKKKNGPTSVIPEPSTSLSISPGSQTPEARTPISANLTSNNLASPQWLEPFDEIPLSDLLYPHNGTPNTGDVPQSKRPQMVGGTSLEASEQPPMKKSRIQVTDSQNLGLPPSKCGYSLQQSLLEREKNFSSTNNSPFSSSMSFPQGNNMLTSHESEEVNSEELASRFNHPAQPRNLEPSNNMGSSQSNQMTCPIFDFDTLTMWQEKDIEALLASPSNDGLSLDELLTTIGTSIKGHHDRSPSDYSTNDTSEPTTGNHEEQQPIQQQELSEHFPRPQSPIQPWYNGLQWSNAIPQQMDMSIISEESDIDYDHQYLKVTGSDSPLFNACSGQDLFYTWDT